MQAIILAAGMGTRLLPLTANIPKSLLKVGDKSILQNSLFTLYNCGLYEITIVIGYHSDKIKEEVKTHKNNGLPKIEINYVENSLYQDTSDAFSLWLAKDELVDEAIIIDGDLLFTKEMIKRIINALNTSGEVCLAIDKERISKRETSVQMASSKITKIIRGCTDTNVDGRYIGITGIKGDSLSIFKNKLDKMMKNNSKNIAVHSHAIQMMINGGHYVYGIDMSDLPWAEIDTLEDFEYAKKIFKLAQDFF